ncbi:uncharacterized protein LOC111891317 [Lactuca sativa]|uniref:Uncharacterized protein n=1 Tax=Lactuca sativa TaxID=4236 RepID=A0A9R1XRU1_LACSA|nr:uncharacterized protein LOC111891317 [Lactuca sativa]XP_042756859.1 uncharacterized protein LOC111891317 [Lactuca sativa]XP_042756861.1 uncharacterized protein LOC111891317 [Lactuca sativa]XP_042756862.1 uncharacterized protein LOC111891317 [Lactuca sativa]XP_042756867.1 uncharacterized protein LOC111891317 [Lactuca sativa]XP_042756878.1 uncharacterized protein LOC111891317 [Lactuca sativa]XP_042756879.1 uncharacterized protein LOC111891317 [Lactuca sativa]XP_042756882.1 uncharacterized p
MTWTSPADAMPWVGLYICLASLVCTLAMVADVFRGFGQWKLWFPCRFFTINAASITLIAITTKLLVDLSTNVSDNHENIAKCVSIMFLITMLANFLPSLGLMNDKELLLNTVALCILILTINVNMWIQVIVAQSSLVSWTTILLLILLIPWPFSVALTVSASRRALQQRYKELHSLASNRQEIKFSSKGLKRYVKQYWMMADTGNPQFVIACSAVSCAFGDVCLVLAFNSVIILVNQFVDISNFQNYDSDYKWSVNVIITLQSLGVILGSIAPIFRCLTTTGHFNLSMKWSKHHINVFRVEKHWIQTLQLWKSSPVPTHIPGSHCKKVFHKIRNLILNFCIALQITIVVICKTECLIPRFFLILFSYCYHFGKSYLKRFNEEPNASNSNVVLDTEEYTGYVLQIEPDAKLSKRILRNALNSITRLLQESEKKEPRKLMKLLEKSKGFIGIVEFDNDQVPPLHPEEVQNCWSLVAVTLTTIALALPDIANCHVKGLLSSMKEGLQFVRHVEESLNANDELVKARKAARHVWTDVEVYCKWLQIDLQKKAHKGKTSKEILKWLGDEAAKIVIQFKTRKNVCLDHSLRKFIAASSMYRISQTILLHCNEQENWPTDDELFEFISIIIADLLCACFTNLPRVITMKCHDDAIEKREESIQIAAQLLGRSKKILKMLKKRQLPNLDMESMGYIDKWHALSRSQIPNCCFSSARSQLAFSSSSESLVVTII